MDLESVIQNEVNQEKKDQISFINAYMWNLEMVQMDLLAGQE